MTNTTTSKALFAAGCFWGIEASFRALDGVTEAISGYAGGHMKDPDYRSVCNGTTGHAEAVEVTYDPSKISFEALVKHFWQCHNPTQRNRQGPDFGTQYRSAIFYYDDEQKRIATQSKEAAQPDFGGKIVTEITAFTNFYAAEDYHQRYFEKKGMQACHK